MTCCENQPQAAEKQQPDEQNRKHVALVGSPNVGKRAVFGQLSNTYVTVSH